MKWEKQPLEAVADFRLGKMLDEKKNRGDLSPYLANVNVRWGGFDLDNLREMRFQQHELDKYRLQHGDIVMCEGGEPGRCAIWKDQVPCMMIQKALHRIRPHECLNAEFLYYLLMHKGRAGYLSPLFTGATIKHLPREKLALVEIEVPPLSYQNRVADVLSAYDDLLENNARRIRLLEASARLLYEEWFVRLRFPGHEHTPIHDGLPKGWQKKPLVELADMVMGQSPPSRLYNEDGEGLPFHQGVSDFGDRFVTHRIFTTSMKRIAEAGDILCSVRAPVGRLNIAPDKLVIGRGLAALRSRTGYQSLLYYQLKNHFFKEDLIGGGAIFASVSKKVLQEQELLMPTAKLAREFEDFSRPVDEQIRLLWLQNHKLQQARDLLLPRLMNGEIAV